MTIETFRRNDSISEIERFRQWRLASMQRIAALKDAKDDVENAGKPKGAMTMAGIKDVACEAGVSVSTVSYVLSGKRSISAKTSDKVMAAVEKLGYTSDASARKMRGIRS